MKEKKETNGTEKTVNVRDAVTELRDIFGKQFGLVRMILRTIEKEIPDVSTKDSFYEKLALTLIEIGKNEGWPTYILNQCVSPAYKEPLREKIKQTKVGTFDNRKTLPPEGAVDLLLEIAKDPRWRESVLKVAREIVPQIPDLTQRAIKAVEIAKLSEDRKERDFSDALNIVFAIENPHIKINELIELLRTGVN